MPAPLLNNIVNWAKENEQVRVMLLTSSRANDKAPQDIFTDYDIEFAIAAAQQFLQNDKWLHIFGKPIAVIAEDTDHFAGKFAMRLVFYEDYTKIDFRIWPVEKFSEQGAAKELFKDWDIGYKVLVDKDNLTTSLAAPTFNSFNIQQPGKKQFEKLLADFWWDTTYVAKSLWRHEIFYAKYMLDSVIRFQYLEKLLEWHIGAQHNWNITTNKHGRLFKKYLSPQIFQQLEATFAAAQIEHNWPALFNCCELVRTVAVPLATQLGFNYPQQQDEQFSAYLHWVQQQPKPDNFVT